MQEDVEDQAEFHQTRSGHLELDTKRLRLRRPHRRDLPNIAREIGKARIAQYLATVPHPYSFIDATNWFGGIKASWGVNSFTFGLYEKTAPDLLIGVISVEGLLARSNPCPVLGYWLAVERWGHGLMSEAVGAALSFAFGRLNVPIMEATFLEKNPASGRVLEKNHFAPVEQTLLWSRYQMAYLPGTLMKCEKSAFKQAHEMSEEER